MEFIFNFPATKHNKELMPRFEFVSLKHFLSKLHFATCFMQPFSSFCPYSLQIISRDEVRALEIIFDNLLLAYFIYSLTGVDV